MKKLGKESEKGWFLRYHPAVLSKDMPSLDTVSAHRVRKAIEVKLSANPLLYGAPLHGVLLRLFKLRVGDWRVAYEISPPYVHILLIAHRKDIYAQLRRRFGL
jgi:mRNA interferase RelE/StbE